VCFTVFSTVFLGLFAWPLILSASSPLPLDWGDNMVLILHARYTKVSSGISENISVPTRPFSPKWEAHSINRPSHTCAGLDKRWQRCLDHDLQTCVQTTFYYTPRLVQAINMSNASVTEAEKGETGVFAGRGVWNPLINVTCLWSKENTQITSESGGAP